MSMQACYVNGRAEQQWCALPILRLKMQRFLLHLAL